MAGSTWHKDLPHAVREVELALVVATFSGNHARLLAQAAAEDEPWLAEFVHVTVGDRLPLVALGAFPATASNPLEASGNGVGIGTSEVTKRLRPGQFCARVGGVRPAEGLARKTKERLSALDLAEATGWRVLAIREVEAAGISCREPWRGAGLEGNATE